MAGTGEVGLLERLLEACPDCIVTVGRDWRFRYANQRAVALLGGPAFLGKDLFEYFRGIWRSHLFRRTGLRWTRRKRGRSRPITRLR